VNLPERGSGFDGWERAVAKGESNNDQANLLAGESESKA